MIPAAAPASYALASAQAFGLALGVGTVVGGLSGLAAGGLTHGIGGGAVDAPLEPIGWHEGEGDQILGAAKVGSGLGLLLGLNAAVIGRHHLSPAGAVATIVGSGLVIAATATAAMAGLTAVDKDRMI